MGELHSAFGVTELAGNRGEVAEALAEAVDGGGGRGAGDGRPEPVLGNVLVDELHCVDEAHVEGFGVLGLVLAAEREEDGRGGGVSSRGGGDEEEEEGEEGEECFHPWKWG